MLFGLGTTLERSASICVSLIKIVSVIIFQSGDDFFAQLKFNKWQHALNVNKTNLANDSTLQGLLLVGYLRSWEHL